MAVAVGLDAYAHTRRGGPPQSGTADGTMPGVDAGARHVDAQRKAHLTDSEEDEGAPLTERR